MRNQLICFFSFISFYSFSQDFEKLGVKFTITDSLITFHNIDKKFKTIKIIEKYNNGLVNLEYSINYQIEGDIIEQQKLYSKNGEICIEIITDKLKIKFIVQKFKTKSHIE